ncbi:hypothetical protein GQ53DRAFT_749136 [Thozetella sp. PMI_491]|nr:hypothetical protein GQ53DRAFT_749136 [Thozetella sp. PMI_491]
MKFSAALTMAIAPVALAKAVHNVYPIRRDGLIAREGNSKNSNSNNNKNNNNNKGSNVGSNSILVSEANLAAEQAFLLGQVVGASQAQNEIALLQQALLLWVNGGGLGTATTIINVQPAATQTIVAGAPGIAAPPAAGVTAAPAAGTPPTGTTGEGATGTVAATGTTHSVDVGKGGLAFSPNSLTAAVGDTVIFTFFNANHTATQSAFDTPCDPLAGGMDSGFQPNANGTVNPPPQVAMQVQVATPLWFYCRQTGHCGKGMVMSINPTAEKTQAIFQSKAIQQKGQGSGSAITGNGGAAAGNGTAAAPPAESSAAAAVGGAASLTATLGGGAEATNTLASPAATGAAGVTTGTGTIGTNGECICAVQCMAGSFASNQQGINAFGGVPALF